MEKYDTDSNANTADKCKISCDGHIACYGYEFDTTNNNGCKLIKDPALIMGNGIGADKKCFVAIQEPSLLNYAPEAGPCVVSAGGGAIPGGETADQADATSLDECQEKCETASPGYSCKAFEFSAVEDGATVCKTYTSAAALKGNTLASEEKCYTR